VQQSLSGSHRTVAVALAAYQKVAAEVRGEGVATVRVARPLADAERDRLAAALASSYGRDVHLNVIVDPEVIGGIRVEIGDDVIDGTVASRLDDAGRRLAG
jgi:F-type H+-transporting ATPase subunit delta